MPEKITYEPAEPELVSMAQEIINQYLPEINGVSIFYLMRSQHAKSRGRRIIGTCQRQGPRMTAVHGYDFIIETAQDIWDEMTDFQRRAYLLHEHCHIGNNGEDEDGDAITYSRPHDAEEFQLVLEQFGPWKKDLEALAGALKRHELGAGEREAATEEPKKVRRF